MNKDQRNQLIEYCNKFNTQDLIECADVHYKGQPWDSTMIDSYSIDNIIQVVSRIFKQIKEATVGEDYIVYPWEHVHPALGSNNLGNHLPHILTCIEQKKPFNEFIQSVQWLVKYLFDFNLWNKERAEINVADLEEKRVLLLSLFEKLKQELEVLEKVKSEFNAEKSALSKEKEALTQFIEQKRQELAAIADALTTVTNQKNDIDNIFKGVQTSDAQIRAIQKNHTELYDQLKNQKETQDNTFKTSMTLLDEEKVKLQKAIENGEEKVKYFNGLEQFIQEKQKEIIELGALAAGAALGGTFGLRQDKLDKGLNFWRWAVPAITALALAWVVLVFTCLKSNTGTIWVDVILNLAKTVPAFVLMGFVFKQYTKERNLQEEYAFKAAIANTIKAYSDLLKGEDRPENASRQNMLSDAVRKVQSSPKLYLEKSGRIFSFSTKGLANSINNLNEVISNLRGK